MEVPLSGIEQHEEHVLKVKVETTMEHYHEVRFFRRGHHRERVDVRKWFGLGSTSSRPRVFDNVVLMVTIKLPSEIKSKRRLKGLQRVNFGPVPSSSSTSATSQRPTCTCCFPRCGW